MRTIGIQHRVKFSKEGEALPTSVAILDGDRWSKLSLATETDEFYWLRGQYPLSYRKVASKSDLDNAVLFYVKWKKVSETVGLDTELLKQVGKDWYIASDVPSAYQGLQTGDQVAMVLGGSGDNLAYALARQAKLVDATILRIPPFSLPVDRDVKEEARNLAKLLLEQPELFYSIEPRDLAVIELRECYRARIEAMKARIGAEARLQQRLTGQVLRQKFGSNFEGSIEAQFDLRKTNDRVLLALAAEENDREKELIKCIKQVPIYQKIFEPITGVGPMIAARLISAIIDVRRFSKKAKLVKFCGVHVLPDGRFVRRRNGEVANWHNDARQALYLIGDQFNRRPNSEWGIELRAAKVRLRQIHPEVVTNDKGKKLYTDGHIHKMATWRTLTRFVEHLYKVWWELEGGQKTVAESEVA